MTLNFIFMKLQVCALRDISAAKKQSNKTWLWPTTGETPTRRSRWCITSDAALNAFWGSGARFERPRKPGPYSIAPDHVRLVQGPRGTFSSFSIRYRT